MINFPRELRRIADAGYITGPEVQTLAAAATEIENLRKILASTYQFIDGHVHYSQPDYDMGPEPCDQFSYEASGQSAAIQTALGLGHDEILAIK